MPDRGPTIKFTVQLTERAKDAIRAAADKQKLSMTELIERFADTLEERN